MWMKRKRFLICKNISLATLTLVIAQWILIKVIFRTEKQVFLSGDHINPQSCKSIQFVGEHNGRKYFGRSFSSSSVAYLSVLGLSVEYANQSGTCCLHQATILRSRPIFVSALSDNHFEEGLIMLNYLAKLYNETKVITLYDIGLSKENKLAVEKQHSRLLIDFKTFPFDDFPFYVSELLQYRWKPLIIAMELREHPSVLWMDTSVVHSGYLDKILKVSRNCAQLAESEHSELDFVAKCPRFPWLLFSNPRCSIYAATDPGMYDFLPLPLEIAKNLTMLQGGLQLIYGLNLLFDRVLKYWVLCALEEYCMSPEDSSWLCEFNNNTYADYAGCNRYDQSALNILLAWSTRFRLSDYYEDEANDVLAVERLPFDFRL